MCYCYCYVICCYYCYCLLFVIVLLYMCGECVIDSERLSIPQRLAVLQLAVAGSVFLLDMVHLPRRVKEESLRQFVSDVFGSRQSLKLGMWYVWGVGVGGWVVGGG